MHIYIYIYIDISISLYIYIYIYTYTISNIDYDSDRLQHQDLHADELRRHQAGEVLRVRVLLSFQQPRFQQITNINVCSAAWSAFHMKRVCSGSLVLPGAREPLPQLYIIIVVVHCMRFLFIFSYFLF